jgi:hypothetical protein
MSKHIGRAISDDIWSASVNRPSRKIYEQDRKEQKERSRNWEPNKLEINELYSDSFYELKLKELTDKHNEARNNNVLP